MRTKRSRRPKPNRMHTPLTSDQRRKAHRSLPSMIGRVVTVDFTGFDFEELDCNGVAKARHRLMRTALNPDREEELLASGEIVTLHYTQTKLRRMCLLKFESISQVLKENIERSQNRRHRFPASH